MSEFIVDLVGLGLILCLFVLVFLSYWRERVRRELEEPEDEEKDT